MKKIIAIVIGVAIVLVVAGVAFGLSTYSDKEIDELTNPEPESEATEITEVQLVKIYELIFLRALGYAGSSSKKSKK